MKLTGLGIGLDHEISHWVIAEQFRRAVSLGDDKHTLCAVVSEGETPGVFRNLEVYVTDPIVASSWT